MRAVGSLTQNSDGLRSAMMATWSAENHLVRLRLAKTFPQTGKRTVDCPQGDLKLICEEEVVATPNPRIRQVRVNVYDAQYPARRIVRLVLLAFND
ncbi:Bacterial type II secretion system protein I/J [compost metagenome]